MGQHGATTASSSFFSLYLFLVYYITLNAYAQAVTSSTQYFTLCEANGGNGQCDPELNDDDCGYDGGDCCENTCIDGVFSCGSNEFDCKYNGTADPLFACEHLELRGDGRCDSLSNDIFCLYDGGDCCPCTCSDCSEVDCLDPDASQQLYDCEEEPTSFRPCVSEAKVWMVENTSQARALAEAANCSDGVFHVSWKGNLVVDKTIWVVNRTVFNVTGVGSSAEMDGDSTTRLFTVVNASLYMNNMIVSNGNATGGGAIAASNSTLIFNRTGFTGNTASKDGGAIFTMEDSNVSFDGVTKFFNNSASSSGALYITASSIASFRGETVFTENVGGALSVRDGSLGSWTAEVTFSGQEGDAALDVHDGSTVWWASRATFSNNTDRALFVGGNSTASWSGQTFFSDNTGGQEGGAVYADEGGSVSWSGETYFERNNAAFEGGAIFVLGGTIHWSSTTHLDSNFIRDFEKGDGRGGAIFIGNKGHASWTGETVFNNNSAGDSGGGVFVSRAATLEWSGETNFTSNRAGSFGGAVGSEDLDRSISSNTDSITAADEQSSLHIGGITYFINNNSSGSGGGMVLLGSLNLTVSSADVVFRGNFAAESGGGIFISGTDDGPEISGISFISNSAKVGGGMYATASGTNIDGCTFADNSAEERGGAIHSVAGVKSFINSDFRRNEALIGGALMLSGTVTVTKCSFVENVSGMENGPAVYNFGYLSAMADLLFIDNRFNCGKETYFSYNGGGPINETVCAQCSCKNCSPCENCNYGDVNKVPTCEEALEHTTSNGGTIEQLEIDAGYWRATNDSIKILECYYDKACHGGVTGGPDYCIQGYEGAYCSVCSKDYSPGLGRTCTKCSDSKVGIMLAIVLGALGTAVGVIIVLHLLSEEKEGAGRGIVDRITRIIPLHTLKIVVVAWQILTQFAAVAHITYPDVYQHLVDVIDMVNLDLSWVIGIECIVRFNFHGTMLLSTTGPLALLGFLGLTYCVAVRVHRGKTEALRNVWHKHLSAILLLTFLVYSSVSAVIFQMFDCEKLDDGKDYLRADYSIECNTAWHRALMMYSAVMILLYPVGIPALYAYLLFKNRDVLAGGALRETDETVQLTSDLWKPYKPSRFYYEVIECGRRLLLTGGVLLVDDDTSAQVAVIFIIAVSFGLLLEALAPYESRIDRWVSRTGHAVVYGSMYFALLQKTEISNETQASQMVFEWVLIATHILMVATIAINAVMLAYSTHEENRTNRGERVLPVDDFSGIESSTWHKQSQPQACLHPRRQARLVHLS